MPYIKDTIAARATAPGRGGIGIIRVSGPGVKEISRQILGEIPEPRLATYSDFSDDEDVIDQGIALYFNSPGSFTGEDVLELQAHGGPVVLEMLLNRVISLGARIAAPGEFSQRAYLNDKMDLAQAEAIADLINSSTEAAARGAVRSLQGEFSTRINHLVAKVIELRIFVEASIDFPEEEIDFLSDERIEVQLAEVHQELDKVLDETSHGALLVEGASVVLMGKPNAGKSSLMNLLTGRETSIVTDIPGTTRDVVNETLQLDGIPLQLVDTAGIRESLDEIEAEGVKRALAAGEEADLVIAVVDASEPDAMKQAESLLEDRRTVVVFNKIDIVADTDLLIDGIQMSAKTGLGLQSLKDQLKKTLGLSLNVSSGFTARTRHIVALGYARDALVAARSLLVEQRAGELVAEELRVCQQNLSEITGVFTADDLLGEIFGSFCIGK
ncbi:MAG: tRNA uridine-5-carboxymethylaminomethyl(34) synthesis GTPase MnmE [Gammaproteobacteria bacterium]|jgi:tRNA modification GTPase|nr:tRNA uridine-5-carboxymethylaminomethyl(34) synthesis GTPase MnmE [Gammaproteobacteria bacterium]MBT3869252.1 tRNA uridine-5-carboxymethylaminomethyl(34) synthesis GTPase MnmE [Gammaproteobacteria bacterium]MBT4377956.1 tRNA uridine-5-carboxymethylaminomethyl(34) synthesis GTPase MnmE [Gammaproteobacteria bacterium]MBT4616635.1 tRNA uridine-5-carboxymethylaminomethyl(34) synthesis GTPase MnmE [Gammaproteobacteria bacterium]MBT5790607.1 tRNA uridine-5-carboxymethylaminomethyl(34) synthesis GT